MDADLGGGLIKQRVARPGKGRSGGYRTIIAFRAGERAVFLVGFAKNERENIADHELLVARRLGAKWLAADAGKISKAVEDGEIKEVSEMKTKKRSKMTEALLETAEGMHRISILGDVEYRQITVRLLGEESLQGAQSITAKEIRNLREKANLSQAAFARYLNLTPGYISQLERGTKIPKGPALALLNVIRRKGFQAIL